MKKTIILVLVCIVAYGVIRSYHPASPEAVLGIGDTNQSLETAVRNQESNVQVEGEGTVIKLLPDDLQGSRHQRILLRLASGGTLLIAHNIDIAPRIEGLEKGDTIRFCGEFEWNAKGGVVHWTHHDPQGRHPSGWIKFNGQAFQ
jgi:hypothetical protein